jgi:hypothetical protein
MHSDRHLISVATGLLAMALVWGCSPRPAVFRAFADGTMAWWSMNLYADKTFDMHLTASDFEGKYALDGDTIWLSYVGESVDTAKVPVAYLIDRENGAISSLTRAPGNSALVLSRNDWMQITEDHLNE